MLQQVLITTSTAQDITPRTPINNTSRGLHKVAELYLERHLQSHQEATVTLSIQQQHQQYPLLLIFKPSRHKPWQHLVVVMLRIMMITMKVVVEEALSSTTPHRRPPLTIYFTPTRTERPRSQIATPWHPRELLASGWGVVCAVGGRMVAVVVVWAVEVLGVVRLAPHSMDPCSPPSQQPDEMQPPSCVEFMNLNTISKQARKLVVRWF